MARGSPICKRVVNKNMAGLIWIGLLAFLVIMAVFLAWMFNMLSMYDDGRADVKESPAVLFFELMAAAITEGNSSGTAAVACGTTAECVEGRLTFHDASLCDVFKPAYRNGRAVFRLHFEIDADNVSQDHVLFLTPCKHCVVVLSSYVDVHPATVHLHSWNWASQLSNMVIAADAALWNVVFDVSDAFDMPVSVSCHVSVAVVSTDCLNSK